MYQVTDWGSVGSDIDLRGNYRSLPFALKASWSGEETLGYYGSDLAVALHGNIAGHAIDGSATFGGEEHDLGALFDDLSGDDDADYGLSFFKRLGRGIKSATRSVSRTAKAGARGVASVAETISKNKTLVAIGGTALLAFPPTAPAGAAVLTAVACMRTAEAVIPKSATKAAAKLIAKRRSNARKVVVNTAKAAAAGNKNAARALKVYKAVHKARKTADAKGRKFAFVVQRSGIVHRVK